MTDKHETYADKAHRMASGEHLMLQSGGDMVKQGKADKEPQQFETGTKKQVFIDMANEAIAGLRLDLEANALQLESMPRNPARIARRNELQARLRDFQKLLEKTND